MAHISLKIMVLLTINVCILISSITCISMSLIIHHETQQPIPKNRKVAIIQKFPSISNDSEIILVSVIAPDKFFSEGIGAGQIAHNVLFILLSSISSNFTNHVSIDCIYVRLMSLH